MPSQNLPQTNQPTSLQVTLPGRLR